MIKKVLYFMVTPGQDIDSITGMVAGGAQIIVFQQEGEHLRKPHSAGNKNYGQYRNL